MYLYCILWDWPITGLQNKNAILAKTYMVLMQRDGANTGKCNDVVNGFTRPAEVTYNLHF